MTTAGHKLYDKLCTEYNDKNIQKLCSLQVFLSYKRDKAKNERRKDLITDVIEYAKNDF